MKQKRNNLRLLMGSLGLVIMFFSVNVRGELCNRVVAIVNDDCITLYELNKTIEELTGYNPEALRAKNEAEFIETREKILERLIDEKITKAKIQELGIVISQEQIDVAIEGVKRNNHITQEDLLAKLKESGITYQAYRENIKKELERLRLINAEVKSKIIIREERLQEYYKEHLDEYRVEERIRLASIYLDRSKKSEGEPELAMKAILERLKQGEDFYHVAQETAREHGEALNGDLGLFKESQLDPGFVKLLQGIPEGGISKPIIRPEGIQVIKVVKRQEAGIKPFSEVRDAIYDIFYRQEVEKRYMDWIKELRKHAYTRIVF